jgi:hypothetical protein
MLRKKLFSKEISKQQKETIAGIFDIAFNESGIDKSDFNIILESNNKPKILYHYTSLSTFQAILSRIENEEKNDSDVNKCKSFVLRATHIEFLNDLSEFKETLRMMVEWIKKYERNLEPHRNRNLSQKLSQDYWRSLATFFDFMTPPFITSFSEDCDNLPMWNTYGQGGKGVAVGIEKTIIDDSTYLSKSSKPVWAKCVYDSHILDDHIEQIGSQLYERIENTDKGLRFHGIPNSDTLSSYFSLLKHSAYEYEHEWRLIKSCSSLDKEKEINFQEMDGILRPYIEHRFLKSVLKEVIVGPCFDINMSRKSIEMSLKRAGYSLSESEKDNKDYVAIKTSSIPFRNINKPILVT